MEETKKQFEHVIAVCRDLFAKKLHITELPGALCDHLL